MFKKALQIIVAFGLLVGAYAGYTQGFAIVVSLLGDGREGVTDPFPEVDSKSAQKAKRLARESFGGDYWCAQKDLKLIYYDAVRGYYMYAQNYERHNEGKRLRVWPFALIWVSKDGVSRKTATSDEAVIDLSQPFGIMKPGSEPSHILHANMIGNVHLRDDKSTRDDPSDDLRVGPLTHLEYDEKTLQITTDSDIFLQDRDLTLTGISMMIQLRRKVLPAEPGGGGDGTGFDAETAFVYSDVHVVINNVTSNGVLPGAAKPEKTGRTPCDVRSDREMRVDLPKPVPVVLIGPPDLNRAPEPTLVKFKTNVRVTRGTDKADRLNCDTLDLTMMPDPKPPESEAEEGTTIVAATSTPIGEGMDLDEEDEPAAKKPGGPLTELKIRKALAQGDAVWLQSEAQGMVARCIELTYEKHAFEGKPDVTYLNGGPAKKLHVEKVEYDGQSKIPGAIKSIMRLTSLDATIFDSGPGGTSKVIARGPGKMEERPARNASVIRTVWFEDEMGLMTWREGVDPTPVLSEVFKRALKTAPPAPARGTLRRLVTLTGVSKLIDHNSSSTLDAREAIFAEFQAAPKLDGSGGDGPLQIQWLNGFEDAHLTAPSRTLTARTSLRTRFENPPPPPTAPTPPPTAAPAQGPLVAVAPSTTTEPDLAADRPEPAPASVEPLVDGRADRVWATVLLGAPNTKGELKSAQLRGGVMVHQDPAPGKVYGNDASGEAIDLFGQGDGLMKYAVSAEEPPHASDPKTRLASDSKRRRAAPSTMAKVEFEGKTIESENLIGLDQKLDYVWSRGAGIYYQLADSGLLDDRGIEGENVRVAAKPVGPNPKDKLVISWNDEMRLIGKSRDLEGRPAAKIEFRGTSKEVLTPDGRREFRRGVEAKMTDSIIFCESMDVYMDKTIALTKEPKKPAQASGGPPTSDAQIAFLDCRGKDILEDGNLKLPGVVIVSQKLFPENGELKDKQRIQGIHVMYDKRTGNFYAPGPGTVWLVKRKGGGNQGDSTTPDLVPVASSSNNGRGRPDPRKLAALKLGPLELTKVKYTEGMRGRFGVAKDQVDNDRRDAEFVGSVEAANAIVEKPNSDIDFDRLEKSKNPVFLTSDILNVFSYPPPIGSKAAAHQLLNARGNAAARTLTDTVQADRITYDSSSELIYGYGDDGKEVSVAKQDSPGQRPSILRGNSVRYNKLTRETRVDDPQAIQFTDIKSGIRPKPYFPDLGGSPKPADPAKPIRTPLVKPSRGSTERKGFAGGT